MKRIEGLDVRVNETSCKMVFMMVDTNNYDILLGLDFWIEIGIVLNIERSLIQIRQGDVWCTHKLFDRHNCESKGETTKKKGVGVHSLTCITLRVKGCVRTMGWGLGQMTSGSIIHINLQKLNNKLVSVELEHIWCMNEPRAYMNS